MVIIYFYQSFVPNGTITMPKDYENRKIITKLLNVPYG